MSARHDYRPGFNTGGLTLAELRRRVRGEEGVGEPTLPPGKQPEHVSSILERLGFGKRGQGNERHE